MVTLFDNETILKGYTQDIINAAHLEGQIEAEKYKAARTAKKSLILWFPA